MKKMIFAFLFFLFCAAIGICVSTFFLSRKKQSVQGAVTFNQSASPTTSVGIPVRLRIPKIGVDARVESVAKDSQGRMDVPKTWQDAAWYDLGFRPGVNGNAVIDGHLDRVTGAPAVFWNIAKLSPGDTISITDNTNHTYTFTVTSKNAYPYNQVPLQQLFAPANNPHLNLITCQGIWDKKTKNYSNREVVYSEMK